MMPDTPELLVILFVVVGVLGGHNLRRMSNAVGRALQRLFGGAA